MESADGKTHEPQIYDDDTSEEFVKNSKAVSSWTIFASALANFSDGYQNSLVRLCAPNIKPRQTCSR